MNYLSVMESFYTFMHPIERIFDHMWLVLLTSTRALGRNMNGDVPNIWPALSVTIKLLKQWKSGLYKIFLLFLKWSNGPRYHLMNLFSNVFHSWHTTFCNNMHWIFIKSTFYLGSKFFSMSNNLNSVTIKTLCTLSWHPDITSLHINVLQLFLFFTLKICLQNALRFFKYISHVATKFCSKSYQSNSIALKTLTTPSHHHLLASSIFKNGSQSAKVLTAQAELPPPSPPLGNMTF